MKALEDKEPHEIWITHHEILTDGTDRDALYVDTEFVATLPQPLKTIIAHYTTLAPDSMWKTYEKSLAQALGGFDSLKQAQAALLKDWDGKQVVILSDYPAVLQLRLTKESVFFEYFPMWSHEIRVHEFKISREGKITYLEKPEPIEYVQYSRKLILDEYPSYNRIKLNGQDVENFRALFLDPDNVKSMGVNKLDQIIYIEQKNKNPEYFVRSDLSKHLGNLKAFKVKSLDEITLISIADETTEEYFHEFTPDDKVEATALKAINSGITDDYKLKWVVVRLKK